MLNNELMIFFIIIILIGLTYYDLKYSIIFCIILFLVYIYFNKLTYESNYDEYKEYDEEINNILKDIEIYRKYDNQNYKLGLKYHFNILKNIKLLNNINDKFIFKSTLEKTRVFLETMIEKFSSMLFSIEDIKSSKRLNILINNLNIKFNQLIDNSIFLYNNRVNNKLKCDNGMFCNDDLKLNLYLNNDKKIYNTKPERQHNMFSRGKYMGLDLGNEVDYHYGENFGQSLRSMVMNSIGTGIEKFKNLDGINPIEDSRGHSYNSEIYYASWSKIYDDREANNEERKRDKQLIDNLMNQMGNDPSENESLENQINNIRKTYFR
jgi:hypothetical protein